MIKLNKLYRIDFNKYISSQSNDWEQIDFKNGSLKMYSDGKNRFIEFFMEGIDTSLKNYYDKMLSANSVFILTDSDEVSYYFGAVYGAKMSAGNLESQYGLPVGGTWVFKADGTKRDDIVPKGTILSVSNNGITKPVIL